MRNKIANFFFWIGYKLSEPEVKPQYNLHHPDYAHTVEKAFSCGGRDFYRFKEEFRMSTGRYKYYYAELREIDLRMNLDKLKEFISEFEKCLNGTGQKKVIEIGRLWQLILNMKSRINLAFDPAMVKRLASIAYFDDTEDLTTYDRKYGEEKIALWEKYNVYDFFLTKPIGELFQLKDISIESLQDYLTQADLMIKDLNYDLQNLSEENS